MELQLTTTDLLMADKSQIGNKVKQIVAGVMEGNVDKMQAFIFAKKLESLTKDLLKELKPMAEDTTIQKGGLTQFNAEITQSMQGVGYDYSECNDWMYDRLIADKADLDERIKAREKFLQSVTSTQITGDLDTGETWEVKPPVKSGKLGLVVKLK